MNIILLLLFFQEDIKEKIKNAPDKGYEIGIVIGSYIPFVILIGLAYLTYHFAKKRKS